MLSTSLKSLEKPIGRRRLHSILNDLKNIVGEDSNIEVVQGGVVHHVLHVTSPKGSFFAKIRGRSFAKVPRIKIKPEDIASEAGAIDILTPAASRYIPQLIHYNQELKYLLLSDVMPGQANLEEEYNRQNVSESDILHLGGAIGDIHCLMSNINLSIRGETNELDFAKKEVDYRIRQDGSPFFKQIADEHDKRTGHLILGDVSPKNIFIKGPDVKFCDLETVRKGAVEFDQAWLIAHIMLHAPDGSSAQRLIEVMAMAYRSKYGLDLSDPFLLGTLEAILAHRLRATLIPYPLNLTPGQRKHAAKKIINNAGVDMSIQKMVAYLFIS